MKRIRPRPDETPTRYDSADLERLARAISGRLRLECARCRQAQKMTVQAGELRLGSSPDLSQIDPNQPGRPRLIFYCQMCHRIMGFVQGDEWSDGDGDPEEVTRWDRLELGDGDDGGL